MSGLVKTELEALSVPQLKKFAAGVTGDDLALVNEVIASKESRKDAIAVEAQAKLAELMEQRKAIAEAEAKAKVEAAAAREELKAAAILAKQEAEEARLKAKNEALDAKAQADAVKEELKAAALEAKAEKDAAKAADKEAKLLAVEEAKLAKLQLKIEAEKAAQERYVALQAELIRRKEAGLPMPTPTGGTGENKSATIRELYAQGLTNEEISAASGIPRKLVSDTVWGIKKKETEAKFLADYRAKKAAEALAAQEPVVTEEV